MFVLFIDFFLILLSRYFLLFQTEFCLKKATLINWSAKILWINNSDQVCRVHVAVLMQSLSQYSDQHKILRNSRDKFMWGIKFNAISMTYWQTPSHVFLPVYTSNTSLYSSVMSTHCTALSTSHFRSSVPSRRNQSHVTDGFEKQVSVYFAMVSSTVCCQGNQVDDNVDIEEVCFAMAASDELNILQIQKSSQ